MIPIEEGLDFILMHFQEFSWPWPRTISTKTTKGGQDLVNSREEALARFKQANYLDCRISAYGSNAYENPSAVARFQGIRTATPANIIVMIDLDRCNFKSERAVSVALRTTLKNIKEMLGVDSPTVIWSGRGYHVVQPLDTNGIVLENINQFKNVPQPSVKFLRFVEWDLSNGKSDQAHNTTVSFKNCMLRIPGSINSKSEQVVRVVQKWDGHRPEINYMLRDFRHWLIDQTLRQEREQRQQRKTCATNEGTIQWIEKLLQTPISDGRKFAIWRILSPYLLNVKELSSDQSSDIIKRWLDQCSKLRPLDFNVELKIKYGLNGASKGYFPILFDDMKIEYSELYGILQ